MNEENIKKTMKYYLALQKKEISTYAMKWMNLKNSTINEITLSQKDKYIILLIGYVKNHQTYKAKNKIVVADLFLFDTVAN